MLTASYNPWLVTLSVIIAVIASYTALSLAERVSASSGRNPYYWFAGGAVSMGIGIWSMHFIGMLAFHLPIPLAYDITLTGASVVPAILASGVALFEIRRGNRTLVTLFVAAVIMGGGISTMHYTGMAAMRMFPPISYDSVPFTFSILIAVGASMAALEIAFQLQVEAGSSYIISKKIVSAMIMGVAIAGMHYTGMAAANFVEGSVCLATPQGISPTWLAVLVGAGSTSVLVLTLMVSVFDSRLADQNARAVEKLSRVNAELNLRAEKLAQAMTEELRSSAGKDQLLAAIVKQTSDTIITQDLEGRISSWNPAAELMFGYLEEEILGNRLDDVLLLQNSGAGAGISGRSRSGYSDIAESVATRSDGGSMHVAVSVAPLLDGNGDQSGKIHIIRDITGRKQAEEEIRTLSQAIEQSPVSVVITDPDANIQYVNRTFEKVTGYSAADAIGSNPRILKSDNTPDAVYQDMWQTITDGKAWQGEFQNRKQNGDLFWEQMHIAPVLDESEKILHFLAVKEDVTLRKQQEERILRQAHFDSLTELPNRFLSLDRLSQLLKDAERNGELVAVLFLDLDDFKKINDSLGHDTGDKLLVEAASRLRDVVRSGDTVGRLGGDEFIILLGGLANPTDASPVVENLLELFRDSFRVDGRELMLTASVGVAVYPDDGDTPSELLRNADSAMYHSKDQGRNTYFYFTDAMNRDVSRRLMIEEQMHGALDRGEFRLCYQPQVDIPSRSITSVEALLRWNNPALGEISPEEFIPIAEQTGLIVPIGRYVLTQALAMAATWQRKQETPLSMAVNLSPRQFRDPDLAAFVERSLIESGISSNCMELEITEGVLMSGHSYIDRALHDLSAMGVSIAMDDFGTGYSSLSYLRSYPFDVLKIDRSFINDITVDKADLELVTAAIAMAHGLGLKVVAEGVETEEQLEILAALGCDLAQGFLFSRPEPTEAITRMLEADHSL
jgi:diguanylate cyclase (GGDEF)-like protein/PAS domain S-box-containing protein